MLAQPGFVFFQMVRMPFGDDVEDRAVGGERNVLLEARDAQRWLAPYRPRVRGQLAAEDLQQRRLAGAVPADHRHALARLDLQRHVIQ